MLIIVYLESIKFTPNRPSLIRICCNLFLAKMLTILHSHTHRQRFSHTDRIHET